jgi:hypothetical protein
MSSENELATEINLDDILVDVTIAAVEILLQVLIAILKYERELLLAV